MSWWITLLSLALSLGHTIQKDWFSDNYEILQSDDLLIQIETQVPYHFLLVLDSCEPTAISDSRLNGIVKIVQTPILQLPAFIIRGSDLAENGINSGFIFYGCYFGHNGQRSFMNNFGVFFKIKQFYDIEVQRMSWDSKFLRNRDWMLLPLQVYEPFPDLETNLPAFSISSPNPNLKLLIDPLVLEERALQVPLNILEIPVQTLILNDTHLLQVSISKNSFSLHNFHSFKVLDISHAGRSQTPDDPDQPENIGSVRVVHGWTLHTLDSTIVLVTILERSLISGSSNLVMVITSDSLNRSTTVHMFPLLGNGKPSKLTIEVAVVWCMSTPRIMNQGKLSFRPFMCITADRERVIGFQFSTESMNFTAWKEPSVSLQQPVAEGKVIISKLSELAHKGSRIAKQIEIIGGVAKFHKLLLKPKEIVFSKDSKGIKYFIIASLAVGDRFLLADIGLMDSFASRILSTSPPDTTILEVLEDWFLAYRVDEGLIATMTLQFDKFTYYEYPEVGIQYRKHKMFHNRGIIVVVKQQRYPRRKIIVTVHQLSELHSSTQRVFANFTLPLAEFVDFDAKLEGTDLQILILYDNQGTSGNEYEFLTKLLRVNVDYPIPKVILQSNLSTDAFPVEVTINKGFKDSASVRLPNRTDFQINLTVIGHTNSPTVGQIKLEEYSLPPTVTLLRIPLKQVIHWSGPVYAFSLLSNANTENIGLAPVIRKFEEYSLQTAEVDRVLYVRDEYFGLYTTKETILVFRAGTLINEFDPSKLLEKQYLGVLLYNVSDVKLTITEGQISAFWYVLERTNNKVEFFGAWTDPEQHFAPWTLAQGMASTAKAITPLSRDSEDILRAVQKNEEQQIYYTFQSFEDGIFMWAFGHTSQEKIMPNYPLFQAVELWKPADSEQLQQRPDSLDFLMREQYTVVGLLCKMHYFSLSLFIKNPTFIPNNHLTQPILKVGAVMEQAGLQPPFETFKIMKPHAGNLNVSGCPNVSRVKEPVVPLFTFLVVGMWDFVRIEVRTYCAAYIQKQLQPDTGNHSIRLMPDSSRKYFLPDAEGVGTLHTMCHHFVVMKPRSNSAESSLEVFVYKLGMSSLLQTLVVPYQLKASLDFFCKNSTDYFSFYDPATSQLVIYSLEDPELLIETKGLKTPSGFNLTFHGVRNTQPQVISFEITDANNKPTKERPISDRLWIAVSSNWVRTVVYTATSILGLVLGYLIFCTKTCEVRTRARPSLNPVAYPLPEKQNNDAF